jgi:DNA-binding NarL/FixJ family response regulator
MGSAGRRIWAGEDREGSGGPRPRPGAESTARSAKPQRILIVEDEAIVAMSLGTAIEQFGHEVVGTVATGRGAVAEAARLEPDVLVMDVRLADAVDGISAAEQILAERAVALVFVTAYSDQATVERIRQLGAAFIAKPVGAEALRKAIEAARPGRRPPAPGMGRSSN